MKKRIISLIIILVLAFSLTTAAFAVTKGTIVDDERLLTDAHLTSLSFLADMVRAEYGFPVYIHTVATVGGMDPFAFAEQLYDNLGYGTGVDRSGVMLMVNMGERDAVFFTRGYGNTVFTDYGWRKLEERYLPYLSDGKYYEAFEVFINGCDEHLEIAASGTPIDVNAPGPYGRQQNLGGAIVVIAVISLVLAALICFTIARKMKTAVISKTAHNYITPGGFNLTAQSDHFTHTTTTRVKIDSDSSSGGGTSVSSSGSSGGSSKF